MPDDDPVALMIPWYAAGALGSEERAAVERHLPGCAGCRDLLDRATTDASSYAAASLRDEHVHPRLLVAYAESPGRLDGETRARIEERLDRCEDCREALERLRETERVEPAERRSLWAFRSSTFLHPVPALAYLLALLLLAPQALDRMRVRLPETQALAVPTIVRAPADRALRDGVEPTTPPLVLPGGASPVLLLLVTDLTAEDVSDPASSFVVEVSPAAAPPTPRSGRDFTIENGRAVLPVLLDPRALRPGTAYVLGIRVKRPGDPMDGRMLYRTRVTIGEVR